MKRYDVVILGSGISALTSAVLLARAGKKVVVLEQYKKPGGYMHSFKRLGELFDTGAHYVGAMGEGQPFRVLLEYLGVYSPELFSPLSARGFDLLHFPEGTVAFSCGYAETISELNAIFPNEKTAIARYFEKIRDVVRYFPTYHYSLRSEMHLPPEVLDRSLRSVVEELTSNERLKTVFYSYCTLHGVRPEDVSFGFHAIVTDSLIIGAYGLNGGGDALTSRFVQVIEAHGGEVLTKQRVTRLNLDGGKNISSIETQDAQTYSADWVISSLHPKSTMRLLSSQDPFPPVFRSRLSGMRESLGIFGVYAVCSKPPVASPQQNHYFFRSSRPQALFQPFDPGEKPPVVFMSSPKRVWSETDSRYPISLHAASPFEWFQKWEAGPYGRRSPEYLAFKKLLDDGIWKAVEPYQPEIRQLVTNSVTSTPLTHLHFNGSEEGSSYGIYHSMQNTGARALGPRTKVLNLLLTGQSCLFPGLLGAATSALRSSGHILGIKPMLEELQSGIQ